MSVWLRHGNEPEPWVAHESLDELGARLCNAPPCPNPQRDSAGTEALTAIARRMFAD